eukprot:scaffold12989_cov157-Skeletonema_menzelii.AAC.4
MSASPLHRALGLVTSQIPETTFEFYSDATLGVAFLATAIIAAKRMSYSRSQGGAETTVVTAFYSLILLTATLRTIWLIVPSTFWSPYYTPHAVMAFDPNHPEWVLKFLEILLVGAGSLCLFSIFILILVYWADILKKYFYPGARRSKPMVTFLVLVSVLLIVQILNATLFLMKNYSTEGMILVKRIVWITVTGNLFFFTRAFIETIFAVMLVVYWHKYGTVAEVFSHTLWDAYILLKHWSEVAILALMLYILQSRFTTNMDGSGDATVDGGKNGYQTVPDSDPDGLTYQPAATLSV